MDAAVSELDRDSRPWARASAVGLVIFVSAVLLARFLGAPANEDGGSADATGRSGSATTVPRGPSDSAPAADGAAAATGPGPAEGITGTLGSGIVQSTGLRIYTASDDQLISFDLDSGLVQRSPLDFTGAPDGDRHVFASQGRVLVWPVGDRGGLASVRYADGFTAPAEILVEGVEEVRAGWSLGNVVVRIGGNLAEMAGDGAFRWGPARPPDSVTGELVGALNQRAVLEDVTVGTWGPVDTDDPGPEIVPAGGELLGLGADGPIWLAADGSLHLPGLDGDVVVEPPGGPGRPWPIAAVSVAPDGKVALALGHPDGASSLVVLDRLGRAAHPVEPVEPGGTSAGAEYALGGELTVVRWSPDSRWAFAADPGLQSIVAVQPSTGRIVELPPMPVDRPADYAVVRVITRP